MISVSEATSDVERFLTKAETSAGAGCFFSFGGISPLRTRSCIFTQMAKLFRSDGV